MISNSLGGKKILLLLY